MRRIDHEPLVIKLPGEWDLARKEELQALLKVGYDRPIVVLDLTELQYLDSTVFGQFAIMHRERMEHYALGAPRIAVKGGQVERLLHIIGFEKLFPIFKAVAEALEYPLQPIIDDGEAAV